MNAIAVLFAVAAIGGHERCAERKYSEPCVQEAKVCGSTQRTCCRGLLRRLFGHRRCHEPKPACAVNDTSHYPHKGSTEIEVVAVDPGNWYVHRQLLGGAPAPNYSYTINHSSAAVTGQTMVTGLCPATGPGFTTIEAAVESLHCMQSAENKCAPCDTPPTPSTTGFVWFMHRDGTSNYTYRINHVYSAPTSSHKICPGSSGYPRDQIGKATDAMIGYVHGTCPPCPAP